MKKLAAGNWKMNGTRASLAEITALVTAQPSPGCEMLICPPFTLVAAAAAAAAAPLMIGAQDCHERPSGAHTGDVSAAMLADAGASHVILGHSERRADHGESDAMVKAKAEAALGEGLAAIVCVGETEAERDAQKTLDVVGGQIAGSLPERATAANLVVAYEPIWAIGTGRTPTLEQIGEVHSFIRAQLVAAMGSEAEGVRILYGGSVKPANASDIFAVPDVDGALVGGASLKATDFSAIVAALSGAA